MKVFNFLICAVQVCGGKKDVHSVIEHSTGTLTVLGSLHLIVLPSFFFLGVNELSLCDLNLNLSITMTAKYKGREINDSKIDERIMMK